MLAYIFIIFFMVFLRVFVFNSWQMRDKEKLMFTILALIPITVISGFRNEKIGPDTENYKSMFQDIADGNYDDRIEPGYIYFNKLLQFFTSDSQWLFIIVAVFLSVSIGTFVYKNARDPFLAILFFVTLGLFQFSLSGIRQTIAVAITLLSMELIKKRKLFWFLGLIFLASMFHKSALFFIPAYFIAHRNVTVKNVIIYFFGFTAIYFSAEFFLLKAADILELNYGVEETNNGGVFFSIVLLITVLGFRNRKRIVAVHSNSNKGIKSSNIIFINLNFISLLLWAIRLVSRTAERLTFYYMPSTYLLLEEYVSSIKTKKNRLNAYIIITVMAVTLFIYRIKSDSSLVPYSFF
ncbi:EpsG family protein [Chryseobacterium salivictor]|uniref:Transmembrane protein EpsG n=1 Tax=Chryseobacterium salivictor TaxID=2547600 RepID=A0A4P6ZIH2_9FLAO|nr:EpsG family protein [Chryseobacterium salivictor]QBO59676.1 Transmembrane protein EpsG [Chryseobacterium salivictor]